MNPEAEKLINEIRDAEGLVFATLLGVEYRIEEVGFLYPYENSGDPVIQMKVDPNHFIATCWILLSQEEFLKNVKIDKPLW